MDKRTAVKIIRVWDENELYKTFTFSHKLNIDPGQFIMITDYETDENPFSISDCSAYNFSVTIKKVGDFTKTLFHKKEGDMLYVRGAYGRAFTTQRLNKKKILMVGGGCGSAPLRYLGRVLKENHCDILMINGARSSNEIIFAKDFKYMGIETINVTDDGSVGDTGTAVDVMRKILNERDFDYIFVAGPEPMLKNAYEVLKSNNTPAEFLLERYMKCGVGVCGQCTIDPLGFRMCVEGPVLNKDVLGKLTEFGSYRRDASGMRKPF